MIKDGEIEHIFHRLYVRSVPFRDRLIKFRVLEHTFHIDDIRDIPKGDIAIKIF
jgi:hypothetical protein